MSNDGRSVAFRDLTANRAAVVIFWSRHCGWALEALPAITSVAERLDRAGKRVVFVVDDETPSNDLKAFMRSKKWTLPIYYDSRGELKQAFANFGTPAYYVLDNSGRIRFDWADGEAELIAQLDAITPSRGGR
jgi:thiol-disulfide isomerase/thioredoxin